jgi:hypothetical protein
VRSIASRSPCGRRGGKKTTQATCTTFLSVRGAGSSLASDLFSPPQCVCVCARATVSSRVRPGHVLKMFYVGIVFFAVFTLADLTSGDLSSNQRFIVMLVRLCCLVPFLALCAIAIRCARTAMRAWLESTAFVSLFLCGAFLTFTAVLKSSRQASLGLLLLFLPIFCASRMRFPKVLACGASVMLFYFVLQVRERASVFGHLVTCGGVHCVPCALHMYAGCLVCCARARVCACVSVFCACLRLCVLVDD